MILNRQRKVRFSRGLLESFLRRVQTELGLGEAQITICLVSDAEIARMNEEFRKKKGATDVLSFPAARRRKPLRRRQGMPGLGNAELGDIAIAPCVAQSNARKNKNTLPIELQILILHGVLHLLGYDHETDHGEMDRAERRLRKRLGLA